MCVTHLSRSCLTCIQIPISLSHSHPCTVSLQSRSEVSCLICIHVASHLQPIHFHSSHDICITAPSMSYLTPIRVSILAPELHPDHVSPPSKSHDLCLISIQVTPQPIPLHLQLGPITTPSRSINVRLTSIHVPSHLHSVSYSCIPLHPHRVSPPSRSCYFYLSFIQVWSNLHSGGEACSSAPSMFYLTSPRSQDIHLTSIHILSHPIQVPRFAFYLHSGQASSPSR